MDWTVTIQPDAQIELDDIYAYVANELRNQLDASRLLSRLETAIFDLAVMPFRTPLSRDPRFAIQGVRTLHFESYTIYYIVDEVLHEVGIVHVAHQLRDASRLSR